MSVSNIIYLEMGLVLSFHNWDFRMISYPTYSNQLLHSAKDGIKDSQLQATMQTEEVPTHQRARVLSFYSRHLAFSIVFSESHAECKKLFRLLYNG